MFKKCTICGFYFDYDQEAQEGECENCGSSNSKNKRPTKIWREDGKID